MVTPPSPLLTLGYGKRSIGEAIELLERHEVQVLADVRSVPWSRYHPDFSQSALERRLAQHGIDYLFLGQELGGRPDDPSCYDANGQVDYEACRQRPAFGAGLEKLRGLVQGEQRVALLCSESRPEECHRSKLVGEALRDQGLEVTHLDEDGNPLSQEDVMARIHGGQRPLFDDLPLGKAAKSRKRYPQGGE